MVVPIDEPYPDEPYYGKAQPPDTNDIELVAEAAAGCTACHLWRLGTQTVFGEGAILKAPLMLIGEQPGDQEDKEGHPFVGPAGRLLDDALIRAGISRKDTYVTNAVKHFKWEPKGSRRLHKKPNGREISACLPWLYKEIELVEPELIVCLGATAAQALLGKDFKVTESRGEVIHLDGGRTILATIHPSAILRAFDIESRNQEFGRFVEDLTVAAKYVAQVPMRRVSAL